MRRFQCPECGVEVWFDSTQCEQCAATIGYDPPTDAMRTGLVWCTNRDTVERCNWSATATTSAFCASCELDVAHDPDESRFPFQRAKRRTIRQLMRLGVDVAARRPRLRFDIRPSTPELPVTTGHADGLITLDSVESEPATRERIRQTLGEPYRTPLGHVRHEIGHWWWATSIDVELSTAASRERFGDERVDYSAALARHYESDDDGRWQNDFVSRYASSHPWEDFAESFAHLLHLHGTFETAVAHELADGAGVQSFAELYERWVDLALKLNALNRSMGQPDAYPFVVPAPAVAKMELIASTLSVV